MLSERFEADKRASGPGFGLGCCVLSTGPDVCMQTTLPKEAAITIELSYELQTTHDQVLPPD